MSPFDLEKLMEQTRLLAEQYKANTNQVLPIGSELAKYDCAKILELTPVPADTDLQAVDFIGQHGQIQGKYIQVKNRVIFDPNNSHYRVGQLALNGDWDVTLLVLYSSNYQPFAIYQASKESLLTNIAKNTPISVAKFKALGNLLWEAGQGMIAAC